MAMQRVRVMIRTGGKSSKGGKSTKGSKGGKGGKCK